MLVQLSESNMSNDIYIISAQGEGDLYENSLVRTYSSYFQPNLQNNL